MILKIIGGIILVILILLLGSCAVYIEYDNSVTVKVKYLFFTVFKYPKPPKKPKKTKKPKKNTKPPLSKPSISATEDIPNADGENKKVETTKKTASQPNKKKEKKPSLMDSVKKTLNADLLESIQLFVSSAKEPLLKLIKNIRIENLEINILAVGEDAAEAALNYGKFSAAIGGFIGWLDSIMTVQVKSLDISVDFQKELGIYQGKCIIKLRLFTALVCALAFFINIFKQTYNKGKIGGSKNGRSSNSRTNEYRNGKNKGTS